MLNEDSGNATAEDGEKTSEMNLPVQSAPTHSASLSREMSDGCAQSTIDAKTLYADCLGPHPRCNALMEENIRLHQTINELRSNLIRWTRLHNEQADRVQTLIETLNESHQKQKDLEAELKTAKDQMAARQSEWESERKELHKDARDWQQAKNVILQLQEENWALRQPRSKMLICRGYGGSSSVNARREHESNGTAFDPPNQF